MTQTVHQALKNYRDNIEYHLQTALTLSKDMQQVVLIAEGDSDLNRKLAYYLIPSLTHWVEGAQSGNMKDLRELFERREKEQVVQQEPGKMGSSHEVLTDPEKK